MKNTLIKSERQLYTDIVRIIAIYCVLIIHTMKATNAVIDTLIAAFTITCVPLFVMVSGALLLGKKEEYLYFFKKRVSKVLLPWLFISIIYLIWHISIDHYQITPITKLLHSYGIIFLTQLWFIPMILGLYVLTPIIRIFIQKARLQDITYVLLLWFLFFSVLPYFSRLGSFFIIHSDTLLYQMLQYSGYYLLGYFLSKFRLPRSSMRIAIILFLLSLLTMVSLAIHPQLTKSFHLINQGFLSPTAVISSISVFIIIQQWVKKLQLRTSQKSKDLIAVVSNACFGIYLIHLLVIWVLSDTLNPLISFLALLSPVLIGPVIGFIIFVLSFAVVFICKKISLSIRLGLH